MDKQLLVDQIIKMAKEIAEIMNKPEVREQHLRLLREPQHETPAPNNPGEDK